MRGRARIVTKLHIVRKPRRNQSPLWYVYAWRGGPCIHKAEGAKPTITPAILDAQAKARMEAVGNRDTFDTIIDGYHASPEFEALQPATQRDYKLWLTRASDRFGSAPIAAFTDYRMRGDIIAWRNRWKEQPRTANKATVTMAMLLGWAVHQGLIGVNVAAGIKQMEVGTREEAVWEPHHWEAVRAADLPAHVMDVLELASLTGLRLGDLLRLEWGNIGERAIILTTRKKNSRAVIPILPELRAWLDARESKEGVILRNSRGTAWTESGLETVWQRRKPEGFDRRIHDLRGTYATWLATNGLTDEQIARVMGWTSQRVGAIRARYVDEAKVVVSMVEAIASKARAQ